jgi:hypothetical protein
MPQKFRPDYQGMFPPARANNSERTRVEREVEMRLARTLLVSTVLALAAAPAMAQHMGGFRGGMGGPGGFHGGMGGPGGFHGGGFHGGFRGGGFHRGFFGGFRGWGYGFGFYPYAYPYPVYYAPPPPPPVYSQPAIYYAPRVVHRHYRRVTHRRHCTCS